MEPHRSPLPNAGRDWSVAGFRYARRDTDDGWTDKLLAVPLWPACLLLAALTAVRGIGWFYRRRRTRRRRLGLCPSCAYNLTGNVSDVCPECGTRSEHTN